MAINTIEYAQILQQGLDKKVIHSLLTGWMDANAGQVKYVGGNEIKVPKMAVDGLGDYNRAEAGAGYTLGAVNLSYQTLVMTQDRGRKFQLDAMDVDESNFITTATSVMGMFQDEQVVPEIDAYRLSKLATVAAEVGNAEFGYVPAADTVLRKIKDGIKAIREVGYQGQLVIHANYDVMLELEMAMVNHMSSVNFAQGGVNTKVPAVDQCPLIATPQNRLVSAINLFDGASEGQTAGGFEKAADGKDVNFLIVPSNVPIAVTKQDKMRIFSPDVNQEANAWAMDYRRYHDLFVLDNKKQLIFANFKDAK